MAQAPASFLLSNELDSVLVRGIVKRVTVVLLVANEPRVIGAFKIIDKLARNLCFTSVHPSHLENLGNWAVSPNRVETIAFGKSLSSLSITRVRVF